MYNKLRLEWAHFACLYNSPRHLVFYFFAKVVKSGEKTGRLRDLTIYHQRQSRREGDTSEEVLLDFCNRIRSEEKIPEEWKKGLLINLSYCKNWRDIMFLNMASKVFCRVTLERIKIVLDENLREEQAGFQAGRSCTDQMATLRTIVEQNTGWQSLDINFIDFEKPFNSIGREVLWRLLRHWTATNRVRDMKRPWE